MFQGRVMGVGDVSFEKIISLTEQYGPNTGIGGYRAQVCHPKSPTGTCKPVDWNPDADVMDVLKQRELETQKKLKDAESWRSNTPIFSWTTTSPSGDPRTVKVYGYNKELKAVWLAEGPSANAGNSMLISEAVLASKSPEWVAWKSGSTSGLPLPLLLGAAYLLLA
jgi:hypothetical protein